MTPKFIPIRHRLTNPITIISGKKIISTFCSPKLLVVTKIPLPLKAAKKKMTVRLTARPTFNPKARKSKTLILFTPYRVIFTYLRYGTASLPITQAFGLSVTLAVITHDFGVPSILTLILPEIISTSIT